MNSLHGLSPTAADGYADIAARESERWDAIATDGVTAWTDCFSAAVRRDPDRIVVIDISDGRHVSYAELDAAADKVAAWANANGETAVALHQENGWPFLAAAIGLARAGVTAVLVNPREPAERAGRLAFDAGARSVLGMPLPNLVAAPQLASLFAGPTASPQRCPVRPDRHLDDPCWVIFTSGTSGRAKGALFSHRRMIGAGIAWSLRTGMTAQDVCYITLPLCHGNALAVAFSACVESGAVAVLRPRFSASGFLDDIRRHGCTAVVYIGEMWRYLDRTPSCADDADTNLRVIFGNGLPGDIWQRTVARFGIAHVVEHYGATELPAAALTNWTNRPGHCGYIPPTHPDAADVALIDEGGRPVGPGEKGEIVLRVKSGVYRGYVDPSFDAAKVLYDLFAPGDVWWRSGDILTRDTEGYFSFVERKSDGFRWKGENVAAVDVEEAIRDTGIARDVAVFGVAVPGHDGKAGMASLVTHVAPDLDGLTQALASRLPDYALPRFIRLRAEEHPTTGTMKVMKQRLAAEAFDGIDTAPCFMLTAGAYRKMTASDIAALRCGQLELR